MLTHGFSHLRRAHESIAGHQRTVQGNAPNPTKPSACVERRYESIHQEQLRNPEQCHGIMSG